MSDVFRTKLSARETDIMTLVSKGRTNKEVADELCLSVKTVKNHLGTIFRLSGARNRVEAVVWFTKKKPATDMAG